MMLRTVSSLLAIGAVSTAAATWSTPSHAEETTVVTPSSTTTAESATSYDGPNRRAIASGLVTFGLSYIPAVVVAASSGQSADNKLYLPVVGPWLDLGDRPGCGVGSIPCDTETANKVLLVIDGVFQGLGVATTVFGFLTPEHHETVVRSAENDATRPTLHITPAQLGRDGYGMAALGSF